MRKLRLALPETVWQCSLPAYYLSLLIRLKYGLRILRRTYEETIIINNSNMRR